MDERANISGTTVPVTLSIDSGLSAGAVVALPLGQRVLVGGDLSCDIYLRDSGLRGQVVALVFTDEGVCAETLSGDVSQADERFEPGQTHVLSGRTLQLGSVTLGVEGYEFTPQSLSGGPASEQAADDPGCDILPDTMASGGAGVGGPETGPGSGAGGYISGSAAAIEARDARDALLLDASVHSPGDGIDAVSGLSLQEVDHYADLADGLSDEMEATARPMPISVKPKPPQQTLVRALLGGVLVVAVLLGVSIYANDRAAPEPLTLEGVLDDARFAAVKIDDSRGALVIRGSVKTRKDARALQARLSVFPQTIESRVRIDEVVLAQVSDVFRVNDQAVELEFNDAGQIIVHSHMPTSELVTHLEAIVQRDVPSVPPLLFDNVPPPVPPGKKGKVEPGKRVAMVVSDEPAYVLTEDESRYFIGAMLPSGHKIVSITNGVVTIEKQGQVTELEF